MNYLYKILFPDLQHHIWVLHDIIHEKQNDPNFTDMCDIKVVLVYQLLVQCLFKVRMPSKSRFMISLWICSHCSIYHNSGSWQLVHVYNCHIYNSHSIPQSCDRHLWPLQPLIGKLAGNCKSQSYDLTLTFTWDSGKNITFLGGEMSTVYKEK